MKRSASEDNYYIMFDIFPSKNMAVFVIFSIRPIFDFLTYGVQANFV